MLTATESYYFVNNSLNIKRRRKKKAFSAHMSARSNNSEVSIVYFLMNMQKLTVIRAGMCHVHRVGVCWGGGNQDAQVLSVC